MIPLWKLKRELKRPLGQLRAILSAPFDVVTKLRHDRNFHARIRLTKGDQAAGTKFAILLIYQPKGLASTTLLTCRHLADNGYAVLVVSNTALSDASRAMLAAVAWRVLERPNIGYDFGGYRDGIRILREANVKMRALVVMNDSIWWPMSANDTGLRQMEQMGVDVAGMILRPQGKPRKFGPNRAAYLQSYFYWFGPKATDSRAFSAFWKNYNLSGFKFNVIRRGEFRLTKQLMDAGLAVAPLFAFESLLEKLADQPDDYLCKVLHYGTYVDAEMARAAATLAGATSRDDTWRAAVFALFAEMNLRSELHLALRFPAVDLLGMNFLKRSSGEPENSVHHVGRGKYLAAIRAGDLPAPMAEVLAEIRERHLFGTVAVGR